MKQESDIRRMGVVGMFDGVHLGHRSLLADLKAQASQRGLSPLVVTFPDHPLAAIDPVRAPQLLTSPAEKRLLLEELGVEVAMIPFDQQLRMTSAADFLRKVMDEYGVEAMMLGFNNRFGHDAPKDFEEYRRLAAAEGIELTGGKELRAGDEAVSSSRIRRALSLGDVDEAARLLGRGYRLQGCVVSGQQLGRRIGFPTANVKPWSERALVPGRGVYAAWLTTSHGERHRAVVNVGRRPTVDDGLATTVEAHIPGFSGDLYGENVTLEFDRRIRDERKFEDLQALTAQIRKDIAEL